MLWIVSLLISGSMLVVFMQNCAQTSGGGSKRDNTPMDVMALIASQAGTLQVAENSMQTFTVKLTSAPAAPITISGTSSDPAIVTVSPSSLTFNADNFDDVQTVSVTGVDNHNLGNKTAQVILSSTGLANLPIDIELIDDDTLNFVTDISSLSVNEGGRGLVAVKFTAQPDSDISVSAQGLPTNPTHLTFTSSNWDTFQTIEFLPEQDDDTEDKSVNLVITANGVPSRTIPATIVDDDVLNIQPGTFAVSVNEGSAAMLPVALSAKPSSDVVVFIAASAQGIVALPSEITFTSQNWNVPQNISIAGAQDDDVENGAYAVALSSQGLTSQLVAVTVLEDDTLGIVASPAGLTIAEGGSGQLAVKLSNRPAANVIVNITDSGSASVAPGSLTFTPSDWNSTQTVNVTAPEDSNLISEVTTVTFSSNGLTSVPVTLSTTDNDTQALIVSKTSLEVPEAGAPESFQVNLAYQPANNVTVNVTAGRVRRSPSSLTFTPSNWSMPQQVNVSAPNDNVPGDLTDTVNVTSSGLTTKTLAVTIKNNDPLPQVLISSVGDNIPVSALTIKEGFSAVVMAKLDIDPARDFSYTVTVSGPLSQSGLTGGTWARSSWSYPQSLTINALPDNDGALTTGTITIGGPGLQPATITVAMPDRDALIEDVPDTLPVGQYAKIKIKFPATTSQQWQAVVLPVAGSLQFFYEPIDPSNPKTDQMTIVYPAGINQTYFNVKCTQQGTASFRVVFSDNRYPEVTKSLTCTN